jgi:small conductance mechanosensitive channel
MARGLSRRITFWNNQNYNAMDSIQNALELLQEKFSSWLEGFILLLPNFILAVITLTVAHFLATNAQNIVKNLLNRIIDNKALVNFSSTLARLTVLLFGTLIAVKILRLDQVIFSVLAGVAILGIVIGFAFQDIAANFIAGITLVFRKDYHFRVGDIIENNDYMGIVEGINLRDTMIRTFQLKLHHSNNALILFEG